MPDDAFSSWLFCHPDIPRMPPSGANDAFPILEKCSLGITNPTMLKWITMLELSYSSVGVLFDDIRYPFAT